MMRRYGSNPFNRCFRVFLDGEDVTYLCRWADVARGEVLLYEPRGDRGGKVILRTCGCGRFPKPWDRMGHRSCNVCGQLYGFEPATNLCKGRVELKLRPLRECGARLWSAVRSTLLHFAPFCSLLLLLAFGAAAQTTTVLRPGAYGAKDWRENGLAPADLPTTGNRLWAVRLASDLHLYAWNGTTWVDLTTSGTVGPQGPQGIQGPPGPQGATGSQGATGPQGPQGNPGAAGAAGAPGATWLSGTAAPTSGQGADGDFYYRSTTGDVYGKAAGAWAILANLTGPAGPTGATGATGATGPAGAAGADGKTVRNGSGAPSSGLGVDGDFYIDTAATAIYGPKTAGAWGSGVSLIGPAGATGATGPQGPAGVASATSPLVLTGSTLSIGPFPAGTGASALGLKIGASSGFWEVASGDFLLSTGGKNIFEFNYGGAKTFVFQQFELNSGLRLEPTNAPPTTCDAGKEGLMYYDLDGHSLCICNGSTWGPVFGAGPCS